MEKKKTIFKSPGIGMYDKPEVNQYSMYMGMRRTVEQIIKLHPEIFLNDDIYIDDELTKLWKEMYRDKRLK